jgi:hypothetical protein
MEGKGTRGKVDAGKRPDFRGSGKNVNEFQGKDHGKELHPRRLLKDTINGALFCVFTSFQIGKIQKLNIFLK